MDGFVFYKGQAVPVSFADNCLTLYPNTKVETPYEDYSECILVFPEEANYLYGYDYCGRKYLFWVENKKPFLPISFLSSEKYTVYGYIEYSDKPVPINGISFTGKEIDAFYPIQKGADFSTKNDNSSFRVDTIPYSDTEESFEFSVGERTISATFGVLAKYCQLAQPLTLYSRLLLTFEPTNYFDDIYNLYLIVKSFFDFVKFRKSVILSDIIIFGKTEKHERVQIGTLHLLKQPTCEEDDKVIRNTCTFDYFKPHISELFNLIAAQKVYTYHIPNDHKDGRRITPARIVLNTAAFEWYANQYYSFEISSEQETVKNDILAALANIPDSNSYNRKKKDKLKFYTKLINGIETNLENKIVTVLKELNDILKPFIDHLYSLNDITDISYSKIGNRLQKHRNNYAHGNIDREVELEIILDTIVLEWVTYSMVLKELGYTNNQIQRIINKVFERRIDIPEKENME